MTLNISAFRLKNISCDVSRKSICLKVTPFFISKKSKVMSNLKKTLNSEASVTSNANLLIKNLYFHTFQTILNETLY